MTLREKIESDIVQAMRARDQGRLDALRFLKSAILEAEKSRGESLDDEAVTQVITKQVNNRRESIRMFQKGNREDLVAKESMELAVLEGYLPAQLSQEELAQLVQRVIEEVGATTIRDKGRVMGRLMPQVRGKADGTEVNALVEQILEPAG
jgi:uncharacterized protein YqeY